MIAVPASLVALAACDPMPIVVLHNESGVPVELRITYAPAEKGDAFEEAYKVRPGKAERLPAGYLLATAVMLRAGRCSYGYQGFDSPGVIGREIGARTDIALNASMQIRVVQAQAFSPTSTGRQPAGWPLVPISRTCR